MHTHRQKPKGVFIGLATVDLAYTLTAMPQADRKISADAQQVTAGGPATNAAITFAFLGGTSVLVTAVGGNPLASIIRGELDHFGVRLLDLADHRTEAPPVSSIFVLPGGERRIVSANSRVFSGIDSHVSESWLDDTDIVLADGHYTTLGFEMARLARSKGIRVVLDGGSWKTGTQNLLENVDTLICSNDFHPPGPEGNGGVFDFLGQFGLPRIAITRGADAILYAEGTARGEIPIPKTEARDTSGAGDIFHGAFCYQFALTADFCHSLRFAAKVASFSCEYLGTRSWMSAFSAL